MDIVTHAITGAVIGGAYGHPIIGALVAIAPDIPLGYKRKRAASMPYLMTHSLILCGVFSLVLPVFVTLAWLSHIVLDALTHRGAFAIVPLSPLRWERVDSFQEWEFFNRSWFCGLFVAIGICGVTFHVAY